MTWEFFHFSTMQRKQQNSQELELSIMMAKAMSELVEK